MARTDRQQRRQRRAEKAGIPPLRPAPRPARAPEEKPAAAALEKTEPRAETDGGQGAPRGGFFREAVAELKKVEGPSQQQVVSGTAVVIVACVILGVYLYANDRVWSYFVQHVLLR